MPIDDATHRQTPEETPTVHVPGEQAKALVPAQNRFTPGTLILARYRIINLLGRGGMGEVYRADDIKLGQQVALKFIPRDLLADPSMLRVLLGEVRIGREVSHPNVCRLYDVVEYDGDHFIAMQFVDGEDLASLLRRIGRLPVEKAIDIARDLAAGLAAAHDCGVIHRDLKPANVMIDGRGRAHITDFGLAIVSGDPQRRGLAGTPVYMAPEQLSAEEVTTASDVYAFGLIVWEIVTGKRMFDPGSIVQIAQAHNEPKPRLTSSIRDLPPKIEALLMQCLDEDPSRRPQSAREVLAMLPGGDPLAAAVAAGETPSPELVAAAATIGAVPAPLAFGGLALFVAMLIGVTLLTPRATLFSLARFRKPPAVLTDRAEELVRASGIAGDPVDRSGTFSDRAYRSRVPVPDADRVVFLYRRSVAPFATHDLAFLVGNDSPPLNVPGMANVRVTGDGRLLSFVAVPRANATPAPQAIDELFRAAGFDRTKFVASTPRIAPPIGADTRLAWDGAAHIEAALFRGAPVWFEVNPRPALIPRGAALIGQGSLAWSALYAALFGVAALLAFLNIRRGRADQRGVRRAAAVLGVASLAQAFFDAHSSGAFFGDYISTIFGQALFAAGSFCVVYLAVEPYARRNWPVLLISWQRLIAGRWRDPLVGRDFGFGMLTGIFSALLLRVVIVAISRQPPPRTTTVMSPISTIAETVSWIAHVIPESILYALFALLFLVLGRVFIRHAAIYVPLFVIVIGLAISPATGSTAGDVACGILLAALLFIALRVGGVLAACASWCCYHLPEAIPLTFDTSAWFAGRAIFVMLLFVALATYACVTALAPGRRFANVPAIA